MKRMAILATVVLMSAGVMAQDAKKPVDKAFAPLQGTWNITSFNGQTLDGSMGSSALVIKDDKYQQVTNGTVDETGSLKLDATKKPMTIDLIIEEGNDAGKLQLGIIEVTGDTMKLKLNMAGATPRPTSFEAEDGLILVTASRAK
ncbi:MAG TPA: TIGR03067 domain-containing protein [Vicinamibacterales bacterium]|nr:TIGR03067 domain-containing protein [Vicinamibacterales bacterium]